MSPLSTFYGCLYILTVFWHSQAGHSSWEYHGALRNSDDLVLSKRYFIFQPRGTHRVWPNAEIRYCFENEQTKDRLLYPLEAARDRWYANGLPEERFKLTEVSAAECVSNRAEVLLIKYNDQGKLSSTVGLPPLDGNDPTYKGPTMNLSDREDVGMLEVVANYAHEMGHVWGLLHEHQNPAFWAMPYSTSGVVNNFRFNCQNLKDYAAIAAKLNNADDLDAACRTRNAAADDKFSASEVLPILGGGLGESNLGEIDRQSIMLYPSGAGGTGPASPGNDGRAAVLLYADGSRIEPNLQPTRKDVDGILRLYNNDWGTTNPTLPNEPGNPKSNIFKKIFKKKKCL